MAIKQFQTADVDVKEAAKIIKSVFASCGIKLTIDADRADPDYLVCEGKLGSEPYDFAIHLDNDGKNPEIFFDFMNMPGVDAEDGRIGLYADEMLPDAIQGKKKKVRGVDAARDMKQFMNDLKKMEARARELSEFVKNFTAAMDKLGKLMAKNAKTR